jgi:hypothetical protein
MNRTVPRCARLVALGLLMLAAACARRPLPLETDPALAGPDPFLGADLVLAGRDLTGDPLMDRARLDLVEGREGEPLPWAGGWLLQVRRRLDEGLPGDSRPQALLLWLGAGGERGQARLLARADSLRLLGVAEGGGAAKDARLLLAERVRDGSREQRRLVQRHLDGTLRVLAARTPDRLDVEPAPLALRLAEDKDAPPFREGLGSWHLERRHPVLETETGWSLGEGEPLESPYRALSEFLQAARRGRWAAARERADLKRLLALPDGGWSPELEASLKAGVPELLRRRVLLSAPRKGPITRIEDLSGRLVWRVELLPSATPGETRWRVGRLERVTRP